MDINYQSVCPVDEFEIGTAKRVIINETKIAVYRLEDGFYAIHDRCSHQSASMASGKIDGETVACPRHGALFDIRTGDVLTLPAVRGVRTYPVKVEDGIVYVGDRPISEDEPAVLRLER
ncbi:MAG: non-heme iron oxygenase ferredoxin subunit [Candidatus Electryoneaceae bacterium]|nr:non-heme iron oxygenase ferredoxin subunit [Candidatus Electryoneaceae bacterium]